MTLDPPVERNPVRSSDGRSIWIAPVEPYLTHERVLAQEERILLFAIEAHETPPQPSATVDRAGLDVLQADAAAAVAGDDRLVLAGRPRRHRQDHHTPTRGRRPPPSRPPRLRRRAHRQGRQGPARRDRHSRRHRGQAPVRVALRSRAERSLPAPARHDPRGRRSRNGRHWRPRPTRHARRVPGMATGPRRRPPPAPSRRPGRHVRRALPCRPHPQARHHPPVPPPLGTGRVPPAAIRQARRHRRLHRVTARVSDGTFDDLVAAAARQWIDHTADGRTVAVVAETNEHVDALNRAIQDQRRALGHLGATAVRIAGGETAAVGDVVVTRRNDRTLRTDRGEPVRNRDRWNVIGVGADGRLTVSHIGRTRTGDAPGRLRHGDTSGSATPPPPTATKATPSTSGSPSSPPRPATEASTSAPPADGRRTACSS